MSRLGDMLEESIVDDLIGELDKEKSGLVDIVEWARITFKWTKAFYLIYLLNKKF